MTFSTTNCIALSTRDMRTAADHYVQVLGWKVVQESDEWVELDSGGIRFFICQDQVPQPPTFELRTEAISGGVQRLVSNGWTKEEFGDGEVFVRDPFGNLYALTPADGQD
jgi:catechol 2,3-dioxygenase-like lactoylglutathione lyase family enzyme